MSLRQRRRTASPLLERILVAPRPCVYLVCTALAVVISYFLGKEMQWDTLDYHLYAGFSALHDRFVQDYFPAGSQSYFNPYAYVPFYLLARSGLAALAVASILAAVQSVILWLTYELALEVAPAANGRIRIAMALAAVAFALANPILVNQFGSSYADVTMGEFVLAGWLLLVRALRDPARGRVICAGVLLGAASALKLTNSVHALSACVLLLFLRKSWRGKLYDAMSFGLALALSFVIVCAPWAVHLERQFGNPLFPLLNSVFRSAQFPTAPMMDYRFVPDSLAEALWRPFAIATPVYMVDDEYPSPDLRYAVLLVAALLFALLWLWPRRRGGAPQSAFGESLGSTRALAALGCAFLVDWILWLAAAANGRYFIPLACIAAVIVVALIYRVFAQWPGLRNYVVVAVLGAQVLQLWLGSTYRDHVPWDGGPWFQVDMPKALAIKPALYLSYGVQSNAFIVPFLDPRSGFINLQGDYPLGSDGANGAEVASRIRHYAPDLRVIQPVYEPHPAVSELSPANDALEPFGLRLDASDCATVVVPDEGQNKRLFVGAAPAKGSAPSRGGMVAPRTAKLSNTGYLASCRVVPYRETDPKRLAAERQAAFVLDRLEDACPQVFQPVRPITQYFGRTKHHGYLWGRRYLNTTLTAWVSDGWLEFIDPLRGGPATYVGPVRDFESTRLSISCGRRDERYFAKVVPVTHR